MAVSVRKGWVLAGVVLIAFMVLGYAWVDGGREALRPISEPIPVPEMSK